MKITGLEVTRLGPRSNLLAVHTDEGIVGYGEPVLEEGAGAVAQAEAARGKKINRSREQENRAMGGGPLTRGQARMTA